MAGTQTIGGIDVDASGATYIAGQSFSTNFPAIERRATGLTIVTSGEGAGRVDAENVGSCGVGPCFFPLPAGTQVTLRQFAIGDSTFAGWSGCAPQASTCTVTVGGASTVVATFQPTTVPAQVATWVRTTAPPTRPQDLAINNNGSGIVVAGYTTTGIPATPQAIWFARYFSDGSLWSSTIDDATPYQDLATRVVVTPDGDFVIAALLAADQPTARVAVRRYYASGGLQWSREPGGAQARVGLAVDGSGTIFVSGITGTTPYLAIYSATGVELDRLTPSGPSTIEGVAVRGNQLAAGGRQGALGWVGMLDLIGNVTWSRTTDGNSPGALGIHEVAIDSDGDLVFGGRTTSPAPGQFIYGAFSAAATSPQWMRAEVQRDRGQLRVLPDDRVLAFIGYNGLAAPDFARVLEHADTGGLIRQSSLGLCQAVGGIAVDGSGVTYMAGYAFMSPFPAIERRQ
jgi:hypothetical protein